MSLAGVATRVFQLSNLSLNSGSHGVISQADGSYLCGLAIGSDDYPYPQLSTWYRSVDDGLTWTSRGQTQGVGGQSWAQAANMFTNVALAPTYDLTSNEAAIYRSINGGASWSTVFGPIGPTPLDGRQPEIYGVNSFGKTNAIAWGRLDGTRSNPPYIHALSSNAGVSWTPQLAWDEGNANDVCNAMGIAAEGRIFAQYTKFGGPDRVSAFARSDNGGVSWTTLTAPGGGAGTPPNSTFSIACLTQDDIILAGYLGATPAASHPGVWYSSDAGAL